MSGRGLIVAVMGIVLSTSVIMYNISSSSTKITQNFNNYYLRQTGQDIAESGANLALRQLGDSASWRAGYNSLSMLGGTVNVSVRDTVFKIGSPVSTDSVVKIVSIATTTIGSSTQRNDTSIAYVKKSSLGTIKLKGVVQANTAVSILGGITLDGRDHLATPDPPTLVDTQGTYAAWTTGTWSLGGSSTVGGTVASVDYAPSGKTSIQNIVVARGQTYPGGYPSTPDSAIGGPANGYPEGTLKSIAQKHTGGSQYVTDPTLLTYPLSGVTYVELPVGVVWPAKGSALVYGSGILVVHNSAKSAEVKDLSGITGNNAFVGVIIADDIVHIHNDIIGAVIELTATPAEGNCIGNSNGGIYYSKQAILNATKGISGSTVRSTQNVDGWWE